MRVLIFTLAAILAVAQAAPSLFRDDSTPCGAYGPAHWVNDMTSVQQTVQFAAPLALHYYGIPLFGACDFKVARSDASLDFEYTSNSLVSKATPHNTKSASLAGVTNSFTPNGLVDKTVITAAGNEVSTLTITRSYNQDLQLVQMDFTAQGAEVDPRVSALSGHRQSAVFLALREGASGFLSSRGVGATKYKKTFKYGDPSHPSLPTEVFDGYSNTTVTYAYTFTTVGKAVLIETETLTTDAGATAKYSYEYDAGTVVNKNEYDFKGRLVSMVDGNGAPIIKMAYDKKGANQVTSAFLGSTWTFEYASSEPTVTLI